MPWIREYTKSSGTVVRRHRRRFRAPKGSQGRLSRMGRPRIIVKENRDRHRNYDLSSDFEQQAVNLYRKASKETPSQAADTVEMAQELQSMAKSIEVAAPLTSDEELVIRRRWNLGKHKKRTKVI